MDEMVKISAYAKYLIGNSADDISDQLGIKTSTIKRWMNKEGWVDSKNKFLLKVKDKIDNKMEVLANSIADTSLEFAHKMINKLQSKFIVEIDDIEAGSLKDLVAAMKDGVGTVAELLNMGLSQEFIDKQKEEPKSLELSFEQKKKMLETINTIQLSVTGEGEEGDGE